MLESMARIEGEAYSLLARLGASPLREVVTAGGGAANEKWTAMRAAALGVPVRAAENGEASYGAALLARQGWRRAQGEGGGGGGGPAADAAARRREAGAL
jgi:sugar (pentulose or hexulose) kinase